MASVQLSIILPCYNPPDGWYEQVLQAWSKSRQQIGDAELIIVNDGSTKNLSYMFPQSGNTMSLPIAIGTAGIGGGEPRNDNGADQQFGLYSSVLAENGIKLISYSVNRGKGHALREGVKAATGELIIYTDIDFPYTHESFLKVYNALKNENADVAMGIRSEEYYTHLPPARVKISKLLRFFIKTFLRIPTDDTQCGLKGFNQKGKEVFLQTTINRYLFDLEFVFFAARKKLNIQQVVVELRPEIHLSKMNWKVLLQESGNFLKIFVQSLFDL